MSIQTRTTALQNEIVRLTMTFQHDGVTPSKTGRGRDGRARKRRMFSLMAVRPARRVSSENGTRINTDVHGCGRFHLWWCAWAHVVSLAMIV